MLKLFNIPHVDPIRLPLADGAGPLLLIVFSYLLFVLKLGPKFMSTREPFKLRGALKFYNIVQIIFNSVLLIVSLWNIFSKRPYDLNCMASLPLDHDLKNLERVMYHFYYINKILDLMDTIFFVLRKNYNQITMLHLVHHVVMPISCYFTMRIFGYGGIVVLMAVLNMFVHIIMYSYYYLASQNSNIKGSLWFKKYITILQMVQFVIIFLHSFWTLLQPNCKSPRPVIYLVLGVTGLMFVMFGNFYMHAYVLPKKKSAKIK